MPAAGDVGGEEGHVDLDIHIAALQSEFGFLSTPVNHIQTAERAIEP